MLNLIVWMFICATLDPKQPFMVNLLQKIKTVCLGWIFVKPRLIQIWWIWWWCSNVPSWTRIRFLDKFSSKRQNFLIKMKLGVWINWRILNLVVIVIYSVSYRKYNLCASLLRKIKVFHFYHGEINDKCLKNVKYFCLTV